MEKTFLGSESTKCSKLYSGFSLIVGSRLKNWLPLVLSRLLFREIEEGEKGTRLPSCLFLYPNRLLQNAMRTLGKEVQASHFIKDFTLFL